MIRTLHESWLRNAAFRPRQEAVTFGETRITYGELVSRAKRIATSFRSAGLGSGDRVAIIAMNRVEWFELYAACEIGGFIAAPVNARLSPAEIGDVLADCTPKAIIFEKGFMGTIEALRGGAAGDALLVSLDDDSSPWAESYRKLLSASSDDLKTAPAPHDIVHLLYTGGSTGRPKGVARSHAAAMAVCTSNCLIAGLNSGGTQLVAMPMFHIGAQGVAMSQHWIGGRVVLLPRFDPVVVVETIARERVTMMNLAPTLLREVLDSAEQAALDLSSLETVSYAAAPMPITLLQRAVGLLGPIFVNNYGSTEAGPAVFLPKEAHGLIEGRGLLGSIGQPTPLVSTRISRPDGTLCDPGEVGELQLASPQLMDCYWNNPDATAEALRDGWYSTGDMAHADENNYLFLVDRKKNMIITGGENVFPSEVEEALRAHPDVADAGVVGIPDDHWGETIAAAVVLRSGSSLAPKSLADFCGSRIASYKKPRLIRYIEALPRLASGKEDKVGLRAWLQQCRNLN